MNEINIIDNEQHTLPIELSYLFAQLAPQEVEQFYQCYRLWSLQYDIAAIQEQINELQQQIEHNAQFMQSVQPSPIALSALAQLQAYGVSDLDLLDRMLERGDSWLDHTVQLLVRCEELGVIRSDYTQWCENALEGAYDWITSMDQDTPEPTVSAPFDENIEITLIQKLMSEDDTAPKLPIVTANSIDIADQATLLPTNKTDQTTVSPQPSTDGTTEAISLADLKVPTTTEEDDLHANHSDITSDQSTDAIKQIDTPSDLHNTTTESTKNPTNKQREDTIYQFRSSSKATDNADTQSSDHIYPASDSTVDISYDSIISEKLPIIIDGSISEITNPTDNNTEQAPQQENDSEEQTATAATITVTNTVTARIVNNSEPSAEQPEQTTTPTTAQVHLQEDDLALPPVTNTYQPSISWSEPPVTTTAELPAQVLQATTADQKSGISWNDESIEPPQAPQKVQRSLIARLFRHSRNIGS